MVDIHGVSMVVMDDPGVNQLHKKGDGAGMHGKDITRLTEWPVTLSMLAHAH